MDMVFLWSQFLLFFLINRFLFFSTTTEIEIRRFYERMFVNFLFNENVMLLKQNRTGMVLESILLLCEGESNSFYIYMNPSCNLHL